MTSLLDEEKGGLAESDKSKQSQDTKSLTFMVVPGFYLVSFAKKDSSVMGFGDQEVIVDIPKDPKVFLELCRHEIGMHHPYDEFVIIAISQVGGIT